MKLKKDASTSIDLKQSVYEKIAETFEGEIPIVGNLPKTEQIDDVHFRCMARIKAIAERLALLSNRFSTPSHVHRAAHYLGMSILYHLFSEVTKDNGESRLLFKTITESERIIICMDQMERVLTVARGLFEAKNLGIVTEDEIDKRIECMIEVLPENTQRSTKLLIEKLRSEIQVPDISDRKSWGNRKFKGARTS